MKYCWVTVNKNHEVLVPESLATKEDAKKLYSSKCQYKDNVVFAEVYENQSLLELGPNLSITGNRIRGYCNAEIRCSAGGELLRYEDNFTSIEEAKKWVNKKIKQESYKFYNKQSKLNNNMIMKAKNNIEYLDKFYPIEL